MSDEQIAWICWVATMFRGLVFLWRGNGGLTQPVILPGWLWRQGAIS
ncbi:MAG: hypothetical protein V1912_11375 [bacterium]